MTHWPSFVEGMEAARSSGEPGMQATTREAAENGGPAFLEMSVFSPKQWDWHCGYDHAVLLARGKSKERPIG